MNWLPEDTRFSHFCGIQGWHLLPYDERTKKYEIVSPNSYTVGAKYTFTDAEGRTLQAIVASKYLQFDGLFRYTLITHTFPTTIVYEFPSDQPSWLVLETEFSHSMRTYSSNFEFSVLCRYRSTGWEHPTRVEYYVVAESTGDVVHYEWHPVSGRANILTIRWTGRLAENYWVYVYFYSAHAQHFALYNVRFYETVEEPKSAPLVEVEKGWTENILVNRNAFFTNGLDGWELLDGAYWDESGYVVLPTGGKIRTDKYELGVAKAMAADVPFAVRFYYAGAGSARIKVLLYDSDENLQSEEYRDVFLISAYTRFDSSFTIDPLGNAYIALEIENRSSESLGFFGGGFFLALSTDLIHGAFSRIVTTEPTPEPDQVLWYVYYDGSRLNVRVAVYYGRNVYRYTIVSWEVR